MTNDTRDAASARAMGELIEHIEIAMLVSIAPCLRKVRVKSTEYWQQPGELMRQAIDLLDSITRSASGLDEHKRLRSHN